MSSNVEKKKKKKNVPSRSLISVFVVSMKKLYIPVYAKRAQGRFRSDCANAQSDLNLLWAHMSEGTRFDIAAHINREKNREGPDQTGAVYAG